MTYRWHKFLAIFHLKRKTTVSCSACTVRQRKCPIDNEERILRNRQWQRRFPVGIRRCNLARCLNANANERNSLTRFNWSGLVPLTTKVSAVGGNSRNLSLNGNRATSIFSAALAFAAIHSSASAVQLVDAISASRFVLYHMGFPIENRKEKTIS